METVKFTSEFKLLISETESDTLDAKFIICDFEPNRNNVALSRDTIQDWMHTLINKPVVGKVITTTNGTDFSGHNVKIIEKTDESGNTYQEVQFDTSAFGTFYKVEIEEIEGKEYIVAYAKLWKRFSQAYEVIKRRMNSDEGIRTSWEIQVVKNHFAKVKNTDIKFIDEGNFIGHALLGASVSPAYPSSGLIDVASKNDTDIELIEALVSDIVYSEKEGTNLPDKKKTVTSALTTRDLYQKINQALNPKGWNSNPYYNVWEVYPEEHKILAYEMDRESEDDYLVVSYTIEGETVTIGEKSETKLSNLIAEKIGLDKDQHQTSKVTELSTQLQEKTDALVKAGEQIAELQREISELTPFKEQYEAAEAEKQQAELAAKKEQLKELATKGGYIAKEELENSEEISSLIESLDEKGIKALIADRMIQKLNESETKNELSFSSKDESHVKTNINTDNDVIDPNKVMTSFLYN